MCEYSLANVYCAKFQYLGKGGVYVRVGGVEETFSQPPPSPTTPLPPHINIHP